MALLPFSRRLLLVGGIGLLSLLASHWSGRAIGAANSRAKCAEQSAEAITKAIEAESKRRADERKAADDAAAKLARENDRLAQILNGFPNEKPTGPACLGELDEQQLRDAYQAVFRPDSMRPSY